MIVVIDRSEVLEGLLVCVVEAISDQNAQNVLSNKRAIRDFLFEASLRKLVFRMSSAAF